jgi:hypothetical protein
MPQILCSKNAGCNNTKCSFHHVSPAANFERPTGVLNQKPCFNGAQCIKAGCLFNHPSPSTYNKGEVGGHAGPDPIKSVKAHSAKRPVGGSAGGDGGEVAPAPPLIADAPEPSGIVSIAKQSEEVDNPLR